ncbi:MAG: prephenate dehydrogenase [Candidatus Omnitrophica bacterium]|nr:prephenate dehydrogenase [Candidatus Omnitrophota bacterium]
MKKGIKKIGILGVGLMGGSLSLALRQKFPKVSVWGYARSQESYNKLKKLKILNKIERNLKNVVEDADLIVLALPIEVISDYFMRIVPFLKKGAIVFDLGSSKGEIEKNIMKRLPKEVNFVGCHPLCGSEKSGAEFSKKDLYKKEVCLITSSPKSKATAEVKKIWEELGSKVVFVSSQRHDKILSYLSHIPHLISFSLTDGFPKDHPKFILQSFKDLTRISLSSASIWSEIFLSNKKNVLSDLSRVIKVLKKFENLIKKNDKDKIINLIKKINIKQKHLL